MQTRLKKMLVGTLAGAMTLTLATTATFASFSIKFAESDGYDNVEYYTPLRDSAYQYGQIISSPWNEPRNVGTNPHNGTDYAVPTGTNVYAVKSGSSVRFAGNYSTAYTCSDGSTEYIKSIELNHDMDGNGTAETGVYSRNLHMSSYVYSTGTTGIRYDQVIGKSGDSGCVGAHLHWDNRDASHTYPDGDTGSKVATNPYFHYDTTGQTDWLNDLSFITNVRFSNNKVTATIYDTSGSSGSYTGETEALSATLFYRFSGGQTAWSSVAMTRSGHDWSATIPSGSASTVQYMVRAENNTSASYKYAWAPAKFERPNANPNDNAFYYTYYTGTMSSSDPDPYEPNNTQSAARSISVGSTYYPYITSTTDEDWFRVYASTSGKLKVDMTSIPTGNDYDIKLYNASGTQVASSTAGSNNDESFTYSVSSGNYYYIKVYTYNGTSSTDSYRLYTSWAADGDSYEPNETVSAAKSLSVGSYYYPTLHATTDTDYFKYYLSSGTSYTFTMTSIPSGNDYDIKLVNSSDSTLGGSYAGGNGDESFTYTPSSSGYYYIKVYSYSGFSATDSYTLRAY